MAVFKTHLPLGRGLYRGLGRVPRPRSMKISNSDLARGLDRGLGMCLSRGLGRGTHTHEILISLAVWTAQEAYCLNRGPSRVKMPRPYAGKDRGTSKCTLSGACRGQEKCLLPGLHFTLRLI